MWIFAHMYALQDFKSFLIISIVLKKNGGWNMVHQKDVLVMLQRPAGEYVYIEYGVNKTS